MCVCADWEWRGGGGGGVILCGYISSSPTYSLVFVAHHSKNAYSVPLSLTHISISYFIIIFFFLLFPSSSISIFYTTTTILMTMDSYTIIIYACHHHPHHHHLDPYSDVCTKYREASTIVDLALMQLIPKCVVGATVSELCKVSRRRRICCIPLYLVQQVEEGGGWGGDDDACMHA